MEGQSVSGDMSVLCNAHLNEELKYYCFTCQTAVCSDCILERHSLHVHDVKKSPRPDWKIKEVRFHEPNGKPVQYKSVKTETELVEILNKVELCRRKTNDIAEIVTTSINNRAEEILRHIKKTRNQLLEECQTITKQNHMHLNALEKRIHLKLDKSPENEISKIFQQLILNNADSKTDHLWHTNQMENDSFKITYPQIDIPVFQPGSVDMAALKSMFGSVSVQGEQRERRHVENDQHYQQLREKENIKPNENETDIKQSGPKEHFGKRHEFGPQKDNYTAISDHYDYTRQEGKRMDHLRDKQKGFAYINMNAKEIQSKRDQLEHQRNIYPPKPNSKSKGFPLSDPAKVIFENSEEYTLHNSNVPVTVHVDSGSYCEENIPKSLLQVGLHFSVECEEKPVCCICVLGSDSCWIHQGFSTTNSLLHITSNKRKKVEFNFIVEDWTLKHPDTIVAVDYNHRIVKLTPMGPAQSPLSATQNIGWSFHHVDLHPIAVEFCKNGDFLVSLVDTWSYKVDSKSRRQVVRMNDHFEIKQTLEFYGTKRIFTTPRRLSENTNGDVCVLDETSENGGQILIFGRDGSAKFIYTGHGDGQENFNPNGICCDSESRIIISDYGGDKMHILDNTGTFLQYVIHPEIKNPFCVTIDFEDRLWIGFKSGKIVVISLNPQSDNSDPSALYKSFKV